MHKEGVHLIFRCKRTKIFRVSFQVQTFVEENEMNPSSREPPEWFLWLWHIGPSNIDQFVATIRLFKVGHHADTGGAERSWTGGLTSTSVSKEEIVAGRGVGFMLHDKQVQPLCGNIQDSEEQLFGYEVIVQNK